MHVLGTPPAFVLSQDQTLKKLYLKHFRASNHFLNHLLLAINSRIIVGCFRLRFKQIHKFVKGVLFVFALFNLQGTAAFRSRVSLLILARRLPFVKNFFQVFSNFNLFRVVFAPPQGAYEYYHTILYLSRIIFFRGISFSCVSLMRDLPIISKPLEQITIPGIYLNTDDSYAIRSIAPLPSGSFLQLHLITKSARFQGETTRFSVKTHFSSRIA